MIASASESIVGNNRKFRQKTPDELSHREMQIMDIWLLRQALNKAIGAQRKLIEETFIRRNDAESRYVRQKPALTPLIEIRDEAA